MTSRERILAALNGESSDHVPLTTWCFGFSPPKDIRWQSDGREVKYWYSKRMEHIHTMPQPWSLEDDFRRADALLSLGIDDILEVSVPWGQDTAVTWRDSHVQAGSVDRSPVFVRQYETPSGPLRHAVRQTGEDPGHGWVIQPDYVPLFEDFNIPRAVEHAVAGPSDVLALKHLYCAPNEKDRKWFTERMAKVRKFADEKGLLVGAWSAFGMDAAVWLAGTEGAIMMAMDSPKVFEQLMETISAADNARTVLAASTAGIDMVIERGWYSSLNFWSPDLFDKYVCCYVEQLAAIAHKYGKKFAYVITTGAEVIGPRLAKAGVDVLYFVDPVQDGISLEKARELMSDDMTLVGGTNAISLASGDRNHIRLEVKHAIETLGTTNRFILHPVDAIFPDTPWEGFEQMIETWREFR